MLIGEKVNDFDIYFADKLTAWIVARYYVAKFEPKVAAGIRCGIIVADEFGAEIATEGHARRANRIKIVVKSSGIATERPYEYFEGSATAEDAGSFVGEVMQDPGDIADTYEATEDAALATEDAMYRPVFLSTNAITLSGRIQIIIRFWGTAAEIHENYDFVHCTNSWTCNDGKLLLRQPALESLLARELRYAGSKYPICSLIRIRKFIKRGWTINAGQILKMCMQVSQLDLTDIAVLEDQLIGVDVAYFMEVIRAVREKDPEKVNYAYLIEIIDRLF